MRSPFVHFVLLRAGHTGRTAITCRCVYVCMCACVFVCVSMKDTNFNLSSLEEVFTDCLVALLTRVCDPVGARSEGGLISGTHDNRQVCIDTDPGPRMHTHLFCDYGQARGISTHQLTVPLLCWHHGGRWHANHVLTQARRLFSPSYPCGDCHAHMQDNQDLPSYSRPRSVSAGGLPPVSHQPGQEGVFSGKALLRVSLACLKHLGRLLPVQLYAAAWQQVRG